MKQVLRDALEDRGYTSLTPVQEAVLAPDLEGRDLLVSAQTGSGKTVGFGLAIAPVLLDDTEKFDRADAPLALVIAPTRELALQVKRELSWLFAKAGAVIASTVGGMDMRDERRALDRGAHIVAATPGRLRDHIMRGSINLNNLRAVVLDEADEMLDLGFRDDLEFILGESPKDRQTLMFSATVPKSISQLAQNYQRDAERVIAKSDTTQHADITYKAMNVAQHDTENAVINTLLYYKAPNAIVFANTRAMVNRLTTRLSNRGFQVVALSGELSQSERTHALQAMRDGRAQVCVATDVAARGIDLPNLDLVVHAELPSNHETLLHRSGRTGRAGRKGVSALVVTNRSASKAKRILSGAKVNADWENAPSADAVHAREEERMFGDETWLTSVESSEQASVEKLQSAFSAEQLAAAYLRMYRSARSTPEELSDVNTKAAPRGEFGASVWFSITGGRDAGAEPRRLLPMLLKSSGLAKDDIGAIRIKHNESYVQVKEGSAAKLLASVGSNAELEPGAVLSQLAEAPNLGQHKPEPRKPAGKPKFKRPDKSGPPKRKPASSENEGRVKPSEPKFKGPKPSGPKPSGSKPSGTKPTGPKSSGPKSSGPKSTGSKAAPYASPKPDSSAPKHTKPKHKKPFAAKAEGSQAERPPMRRSKDGPSDGPERKPRTGPKGPPPPKSKASSKKNRARAQAAKTKGGAKTGTGGKAKGHKS